jgi:lambda family phage portal protein
LKEVKAPLSRRIKAAFDVISGSRTAYQFKDLMRVARIATRMESHAKNEYNGARTTRTREDWGTSTDVPYYDLLSAHKKLRARSRDLYKNDSTYRSAINAVVNHVVGRGLRPKPRVVDYSNKPNDIINAQLERAARRYMESTEWDAGSRHHFVGEGQRLAFKTQLISGDVIINAVRKQGLNVVPVSWQMVEIDRLDDSYDNFKRTFTASESTKQTVHGINLDEYGAPVSYFFRGVQNAVPAKNIIHSYLQERPEQYIGEPLGTAILDSVYDKHDLDEDYIQKSRAVAKFLWWLSTLSDRFPYDADQDAAGVISIDALTQMRSETMPDIFKMPDNVSATIEPLLRMKKHDICSGLGLSYITVLLDMNGVNFAAASMNNIKEQLNFGVLREKFINSFCQPFWEKFVLNLVASGKITGLTPERFLLDPYHYTRCEWTHDPIDHADPSKMASANISNIKAGRVTLTEDLAKRGRDIREHINEMQQERDLLKSAGIEWSELTEKAPAPAAPMPEENEDDNDDNPMPDETETADNFKEIGV